MTCRLPSSSRSANGEGWTFPAPASLSALKKATHSLCAQPVYAYIVTSIKTDLPDYQLHQAGCGPNFAGKRITLCTCKRKDRATFCPIRNQDDPWKNVWVAGLTSKSKDRPRALAYLMLVERSFPDQSALWDYLPDKCRRAKSATNSKLGDLFEPKAAAWRHPHDPANYRSPIRGHAHSSPNNWDEWHHDISRWGRRRLPHRLLAGKTEHSYRWSKVKLIVKLNAMGVSAHHKQYSSLQEFIEVLQEFDP